MACNYDILHKNICKLDQIVATPFSSNNHEMVCKVVHETFTNKALCFIRLHNYHNQYNCIRLKLLLEGFISSATRTGFLDYIAKHFV